jgi:hypothetical protein
MLHREQCSRGSGRDADLGVNVLHVTVCSLSGDTERPGNLLRLQAAREQAENLGFALSEARGPLQAMRTMTGGGEDSGHTTRAEPALVGLSFE